MGTYYIQPLSYDAEANWEATESYHSIVDTVVVDYQYSW